MSFIQINWCFYNYSNVFVMIIGSKGKCIIDTEDWKENAMQYVDIDTFD